MEHFMLPQNSFLPKILKVLETQNPCPCLSNPAPNSGMYVHHLSSVNSVMSHFDH